MPQRISEKWRARFYAFAFFTSHQRTAGLSLITWFRSGFWLLLAVLLLQGLWLAAGVLFSFLLLLRYGFWRAYRSGYATFRPLEQEPEIGDLPLPADHQRFPVRATGTFSAGEDERYVLLRRGEMWFVPIGEHAIMIANGPEQFLYQFIEPAHTDKVRIGHFLFGREQLPGLEITYRTDWSPQFDNSGTNSYVGGDRSEVERLRRTVFITFEDEAGWLSMFRSLKHGERR